MNEPEINDGQPADFGIRPPRRLHLIVYALRPSRTAVEMSEAYGFGHGRVYAIAQGQLSSCSCQRCLGSGGK